MKHAQKQSVNTIYESFSGFTETNIGIRARTRANTLIDELNIHKDDDPKKDKHKFKKDFRKALTKSQTIDLDEIKIIGIKSLSEVTVKFAETEKVLGEEGLTKNQRICCTSLTKDLRNVKPIGLMALFGDGLGNFIDGLSIGASINQSLVLGLSNALAAWFANIPQELGDFALLVRAGMTPFQALFYNFMTAQSAYLGCIIGILVGSEIEEARWIFSVSAATTLYLSLAVLLPEMNEEFNDDDETFIERIKITIIQIFGSMTGFSIMIILNMYEDEIQI